MVQLGEEHRQARRFPELLLTLLLYSSTRELARRLCNVALQLLLNGVCERGEGGSFYSPRR